MASISLTLSVGDVITADGTEYEVIDIEKYGFEYDFTVRTDGELHTIPDDDLSNTIAFADSVTLERDST